MNRAVLERVRALTACLLLLPSLWGCAAAQEATHGPWTPVAPMPTARSELTAAALDGRIYAAGGIAQWGTTAAFEAYDPATDRWEELPPLPEAVHHLAAAATNERWPRSRAKLYVVGGVGPGSKDLWIYDPATDRWDVA
jgi:N-acetylneuraminic acid mutarotase